MSDEEAFKKKFEELVAMLHELCLILNETLKEAQDLGMKS